MSLRWPSLVWVALIALAGVAGQWVGYPVAGVWRWLAAGYVVALLLEYISVLQSHLSFSLIAPAYSYLGRSDRWQLALHNHNRRHIKFRFAPLPPIALAGDLPQATAVLGLNEVARLNFSQTPQRLGSHLWPAQPVELVGQLGLARWVLHFGCEVDAEPARTLVEPDHLHADARRGATADNGLRAQSVRSLGGNEFRSLRGYVEGDPPSVIDWKSTARSGKLTVRETDVEQQLLVYFVVDCGRSSNLVVDGLSMLGHSVNLVARMAEFANHAGDRYGVLAYSDQLVIQLRPGRGTAHLHQLRSMLTGLEASNAESNPLPAIMALSKLLPQRALVLLFTHLDDAQATGQLNQAAALLRPQHLPMIVSVEDSWLRQAAQAPGANRTEVFTQIAAREHRRSAAQARAQLERLGAVVIEAPPQQIEQVVFSRYAQLRRERRV